MISVPLPALTRGLSSLDCARDDLEALEGSPFDCAEALETAAVRTATEPTTIKGSHESTKARNNVDRFSCFRVFVAETVGMENSYGKIKSILRQSFWAAAHLLVQSGA